MCPATVRDVAESQECFVYELMQGRCKGNQKDLSVGVTGLFICSWRSQGGQVEEGCTGPASPQEEKGTNTFSTREWEGEGTEDRKPGVG